MMGLQYLASEDLENIVRFLPAHLALNRLRICGNRLLWAKLQQRALTSLDLSDEMELNMQLVVLPTLSSLTDLEVNVQIPNAHQGFLHNLSSGMKRIVVNHQWNMSCWLENTVSSYDGFEMSRPMVVARRDFLLGLPPSLTELNLAFAFFQEEALSSYIPPNLRSFLFDCPETFPVVARTLPKSFSSTLTRLDVHLPKTMREHIRQRPEEDYTALTSLTDLSHYYFAPLRKYINTMPLVRLTLTCYYQLDSASLSLLPRTLTCLLLNYSHISQDAVWNLPLLELRFGSYESWNSLKSLPKSLTNLQMTMRQNTTDWDDASLQQFPHLTHLDLSGVVFGKIGQKNETPALSESSNIGIPSYQVTFPPQLTHLSIGSLQACNFGLVRDSVPADKFLPTALPWLRHFAVSTRVKESQICSMLKRLSYFHCDRLLYEDGSAFLQDADFRSQLLLGPEATLLNGVLSCLPRREPRLVWASIIRPSAISFEYAHTIPASVIHLKLLIDSQPDFCQILSKVQRPELLEILEIPFRHVHTISSFISKCRKLKSFRLRMDDSRPQQPLLEWPQFNSTQLESILMPRISLSPTEPKYPLPISYFDPSKCQLPKTIRELCFGKIVGPLPCFDSLQNLTSLLISGFNKPNSWKPESIETVSSLFQLLPASITSFEYMYQIPYESWKWLKCAPDNLKYFKTIQVSDRLVLEMSRFLIKLTCEFVVMEHWGDYFHPDPLVTEIADVSRLVGGLVERSLTTPMLLLCLAPANWRYFNGDLIVWHKEELSRLPPNLTKLVFSKRCSLNVSRIAHLLPSSLTILSLPESPRYVLTTSEIRHLPTTLQTLHCSSRLFSVDSFSFLPSSLTNLEIFGSKKFTSRFAAALPKKLRRLKVDVERYYPTMVKRLPSTLIYLSVTAKIVLESGAIGQVREDYPPNLEFLKLPFSTSHIFPDGFTSIVP